MKATLYKLKEGYVLCSDEEIKDRDKCLLIRENLLGIVGDLIEILSTKAGLTSYKKADNSE
jgi:hypothetical protein